MSLAHVRGVLVESQAKGSARLVLLILATYANEKHRAFPAVETIAALASVSVRMVQKDLKKLVGLNEIRVHRPGGGRNRPTVYEITLNPCSPFLLAGKVNSMKGVYRVSPKVPITEQRVNRDSPEVLKAHGAGRAVSFFSFYSEEERAVIDLYHTKLVKVTTGWLRVTKFTQKVQEAIALCSLEYWQEFFEDIAEMPDEWPEQRTFVRLAWHIHF